MIPVGLVSASFRYGILDQYIVEARWSPKDRLWKIRVLGGEDMADLAAYDHDGFLEMRDVERYLSKTIQEIHEGRDSTF